MSLILLLLVLSAEPSQPCEAEWGAFHQLELRWPSIRAVKELQQSIKDKASALDVLSRCSKGAPEAQRVCAETRQGEGYAEFARALRNVPIPEGADPTLVRQIREEFYDQAAPLDAKAIESWKSALARAGERHEQSDCSRSAADRLKSRQLPDGGVRR